MRRIGAGVLLWGALVWVGCAGSGGAPDEGWIEVISPTFIVFQEEGETARIEAVVHRKNGEVVNGAPLVFESSAPDVVAVDGKGTLTAMTSALGSATITIRSGSLPPAVVAAAIARMATGAVMVDRNDVIGIEYPDPEVRDRARVTLRRTTATENLSTGSVLFSGYLGGLMDRVVAMEETGGSLVQVETVPATLTEVFDEMDLLVEGPPIILETVSDDQGTRIVRSSRDWSREIEEPTGEEDEEGKIQEALSLPRMKCKGETSLVNVGFSGFSLEQRLKLQPVVRYQITKGWFSNTVDLFELYLRGEGGVTITVGELGLSAGLTGKVECAQELASIPFAFFPLVGPVGIAPVVKPEYGIEIKVGFTAGEVKLRGPKMEKGVEIRIGFGYSASEGFYTIKERKDVGEGVTLGAAEGGMKKEFKVQVEPFFRGVLAKAIQLAHWELLSAGTASLKLLGGLDLALSRPFDPADRGYKGPEWNVYAGIQGDLSPLMETLAPTNRLLSRIGLGTISSLDVVLFQYKRMLSQSPRLRLQVTPRKVTLDETISLQADAIHAEGMRAAFMAFPVPAKEDDLAPPPRKVAEMTMPPDGIARTSWTPKEGEDGTYQMNVHLFDDFFGAIGLPYALANPEEMPQVQVLVDTSLIIDPPGIDEGEVGKDYDFRLVANRVPSELTEVEFRWDFGDGTTDSSDQAVLQGRAEVMIRHTWQVPGTYILTATLHRKDTGEQIADTRAQVSVGTRLDIVPSFLRGDLDIEYPFTIQATGLPSNVSQVTFQWNFGDGSETALGEQTVAVQGGKADVTVFHRFVQEGSFGVFAVVQAAGQTLASGSSMVVIGQVPENEYDLTICNIWQASGSGGSAGTVDTWDISAIPKGAVFDLSFNAYSIPDIFLVDYPEGMQVLETGWRGDPEYEGNPRYPGGISGPGYGEVSGLFTKGKSDFFVVRVIGGEPGTAWDYSVICRAGP